MCVYMRQWVKVERSITASIRRVIWKLAGLSGTTPLAPCRPAIDHQVLEALGIYMDSGDG